MSCVICWNTKRRLRLTRTVCCHQTICFKCRQRLRESRCPYCRASWTLPVPLDDQVTARVLAHDHNLVADLVSSDLLRSLKGTRRRKHCHDRHDDDDGEQLASQIAAVAQSAIHTPCRVVLVQLAELGYPV